MYRRYMQSRFWGIGRYGLLGKAKRLFVFALAGILIKLLFNTLNTDLINWHWPSAIATASMFIFTFFYIFYEMKVVERSMQPKEVGYFLGPKKHVIDENGVSEIGSNGESHVKWQAFETAVKHQGNVYLLLESATSIIIPSSGIKDASEYQKLYDYCCSHIARYQ